MVFKSSNLNPVEKIRSCRKLVSVGNEALAADQDGQSSVQSVDSVGGRKVTK
jgi:hypothetical protein